LRLVESDEKPVIGHIAQGLLMVKQRIKDNFNNKENLYKPILNIIDKR
jgi:hypothetical protein